MSHLLLTIHADFVNLSYHLSGLYAALQNRILTLARRHEDSTLRVRKVREPSDVAGISADGMKLTKSSKTKLKQSHSHTVIAVSR